MQRPPPEGRRAMIPKRRKLSQFKGIDKASIRPLSEDQRYANEDDVIDVFNRFKAWDKEKVLKIVNDDTLLARLAKRPMLVEIQVKPSTTTVFNKAKLTGYLIASRGTQNSVRCTTCRVGQGPFINGECRSATVSGTKIAKGACGADVWSQNATRCIFSDNYNRKSFGGKGAHAETQRRLDGFKDNPDIDAEEVDDDPDDEPDICLRGYRPIGGFFAPMNMDIEELEKALVDAMVDVRILKGFQQLKIPCHVALSPAKFGEWAKEQDLVDEEPDVEEHIDETENDKEVDTLVAKVEDEV